MKTVLAILILAVVCAFCAFELCTRTSDVKETVFIRILSCLSCAAMLVIDMFLSFPLSYDIIISALALSDSVLLMSPCDDEKPAVNLRMALIGAALTLVAVLVSILFKSYVHERNHLLPAISILVMMLSFLPFILNAGSSHFKHVKTLFSSSSVMSELQMASRFHYVVIILSSLLLFYMPLFHSGGSDIILSIFSSLILLSLFILLFIRSRTGHSFIISCHAEKNIEDEMQRNLQSDNTGEGIDTGRMQALYKRITTFMEEQKPYLDCSFSMQDLAVKMYSNKLYISKTINQMSRKNFRQFINYYRIQYAVDLFKKDRKLHVTEASEMSGFHSVVSFNMAFKLNMGKTPTEWQQEYLMTLK